MNEDKIRVYVGYDGVLYADELRKRLIEFENLKKEVDMKKAALDEGIAQLKKIFETIKSLCPHSPKKERPAQALNGPSAVDDVKADKTKG